MTDEAPRAPTTAERSMLALEAIAGAARRIASVLERLSPPPPLVDLDGKYGDPTVKFQPKDYVGPPMKGQSFSACSAEFLELYGAALERGASTQTNEKYRRNDLYDAARARGWAARIRSDWKPRAPSAAPSTSSRPTAARPTAPRPTTARAPAAPPQPDKAKTDYPADWDEKPEEPPALDDEEPPPLA